MKQYLTFDDVLIRPGYSEIETRESVNTAPDFLGLNISVPILSANMDYVTGPDMANAMWKAGGLGILHRFAEPTTLLTNASLVDDYDGQPLAVSVGTPTHSRSPMEMIDKYLGYEPDESKVIITIDVAHGDHKSVVDLIKEVKRNYGIKVIAGNVATDSGFLRLASAGADAVKIGIGPGSVCTTRTVTGVGVPQLSAILEIASVRRTHYPKVALIADGGIKNSGDITKAIGAGADVVMLGNLLAGTTEAPGPTAETGDGRRYKAYRGQSIFGTNGFREVPEGISGFVEEKGPVSEVIKRLTGGLKSGMSYVGASTIAELQQYCEFIAVTSMSHVETNTRVQTHVGW